MFDRISTLMAGGVPPIQHAADGGHVRDQGKWARLPASRNIEDRRGEPEAQGRPGPWPWLDPTPTPGGRLPVRLGINDIPSRAMGGLVNTPGHYAVGGLAPTPTRPMSMNQPGMHLIQSATPGRTDRIRMKAKPGSFIIPADVVSGMGQGNTTAGAKIFGEMIKAGPYGIKTNAMRPGRLPAMGNMKSPNMKMPSPPTLHAPRMLAPPHAAAPAAPVAGLGSISAAAGGKNSSGMNGDGMSSTGRSLKQERFLHAMADGGTTPDALFNIMPPREELTPIVVAGGEAILDPEVVAAYGNGDIEQGKKIWHEAVQHMRKQIVRHMASLPGPIA